MKKKTKQKQAKKPWKTLAVVLLMIIWVGASIIGAQLVVGNIMLGVLGRKLFLSPVPTAIFSALSYVLAMILIIFIPPKFLEIHRKKHGKKPVSKPTRKSLGLSEWPTWTDIGLAPVGFLTYLLIAFALTALFQLFPWFNANEAQDVGFSVYLTGVDRAIAFIVLVVVAPIAEEIIFRGWLYDKLRGKFLKQYSNVVSIIASTFLVSLLFGIIHMQWNVGVNVFAMSIVLCGLREITGTIYAGILMHMLKNGLAFYLLYIVGIG